MSSNPLGLGREFVHRCREMDIDVFFCTARVENPGNRAFTERSLLKHDMGGYSQLWMFPAGTKRTDDLIALFKQTCADSLTQCGIQVLARVGDRWVDLYPPPLPQFDGISVQDTVVILENDQPFMVRLGRKF